jgi:hypothetical protein
MKTKLTAVEWLVEQQFKKSDIQYINGFDGLIEQAIAMEKEQMGDAYYDGKNNGMDICNPLSRAKEISFEQYYNENYGN